MKTIRYFLLCLGCWSSLTALAQRTPNPDQDEEEYSSVTTFGINANTNAGVLGGPVFRQEKLLPGDLFGKRQFRYVSLEIVNIRHPREIQVPTATGSRYVFGKENIFLVIRPQYGRSVALFRRSADEGIAINAIVAAGPSIGVLKPYYVEIQEGPNRIRSVPVSSLANSGFASINGPGSLLAGLGESKLTVGLHLKAAASFELSAFRNNTTGVEIGFLGEIYPQTVKIMTQGTNRSFFSSAYLTLFFGTKK
jgi:hypothetical protein